MGAVAEIKTAAAGLVVSNPGILGGTPVFKTGALNHSGTLPNQEFQSLS